MGDKGAVHSCLYRQYIIKLMKKEDKKVLFALILILIFSLGVLAAHIFTLRTTPEKNITDQLIQQFDSSDAEYLAERMAYDKQFPLLRTIDFGDEIKGTSTPMNDEWSVYKNATLGFAIEYPKREFMWGPYNRGSLQINERVEIDEIDGKIYNISFNHLDGASITVRIQASRFSDIEDWVKDYKNQNPFDTYSTFENARMAGYPAIIRYVPIHTARPEQKVPAMAYLVKNDVLYTIFLEITLTDDEQRRVLASLRFLDHSNSSA